MTDKGYYDIIIRGATLIDGDDGGFAMAARQIKKKIAED